MSSGKVHDQWGVSAGIALGTFGLATQNLIFSSAGLGCLVGTLWFSPDLDLPQSLPSKRWGFLNPIWFPYRKIVGRHRGFLSHSPIISTLGRVIYFGLLVSFIVVILRVSEYFPAANSLPFPESPWGSEWLFLLGFLGGMEIATDIHLVLDYLPFTRRR